MRRGLAILALSVLCCGGLDGCDAGEGRVHSTPAGVFYTPFLGGLYQLVNGKLVQVRTATAPDQAVRSINFQETIVDVEPNGFPAQVTGTLKIGDGVRKLKIDINLGPNGNKNPTEDQKVAFIAGLRDGSGELKGLTLEFLDADGFLASDRKHIPIPGDDWSAMTGITSKPDAFEYVSRENSDPGEDREVVKVDVEWSKVNRPPPPPPNPYAGFSSPVDPDAAAAAAAASAAAANAGQASP